MLKSLDIRGLFGAFDYQIQIPENGDTLILTGPNGSGKTTIFRMIESLSTLDLLYFYSIPFKFLGIDYGEYIMNIFPLDKDGNRHDLQDEESLPQHSIRFVIHDNKKEMLGFFDVDSALLERAKNNYRILLYERRAVNDNKISETEYNVGIFQELLKLQPMAKGLMPVLGIMRPQAQFIRAQRLEYIEKNVRKGAITKISENISREIEKSYYAYLENSQKIDASFINVLMRENAEINKESYEQAVEGMTQTVDNLRGHGIDVSFGFPEYREDKAVILNSYMTETQKKLSVFDSLLAELGLFTSLINEKTFSNKSIRITKENGLQAISTIDYGEIPLDRLSSGEKNELIMLYYFIFTLEKGEILMIDEPEISLHIAWQMEFLKEIEQIAKLKDVKVLIATHSPQIIGSQWDKCYDLYEAMHPEEFLTEPEIEEA